jgi:aromatic ring-opening dioxygenase catalytic subunit (LigB family)
MAELVGVFAASHGPIIARDWEIMSAAHRDKLKAGFDEIGQRLTACRPDVLVVVSPDHWVNFFISNLPAVCIGIGEEHDGPPEPFMQKVYPHTRLKGHPAFGRHLLETALAHDFEPALSYRLRLDHGTCIPLWRMGVDIEHPPLSGLGPAGAAGDRKLSRAVAHRSARHRRLEPFDRRANHGLDR